MGMGGGRCPADCACDTGVCLSCSETALQYALSKRMSKAVVTALVAAGARLEPAELDGYPVKQLKALCGMYGLTKPGGRAALVALLCPKICSEGPPPKKQKTEVRIAPPPATQIDNQRCARSSCLFACATQACAEEPQRGANAEQAKAPFPSVPTQCPRNSRHSDRTPRRKPRTWLCTGYPRRQPRLHCVRTPVCRRRSRSSRRCSRRCPHRRSPTRSARPAATWSTRRTRWSWRR
jgi:hypothetical protein